MRLPRRALPAMLPAFGLVLSLASSAAASGVLAVDFGSESLKLSLVKPGVPFDVMLDRDSKRKLAAAVVVRGEDRFVGAEAAALASRYPRDSFLQPGLLLGRSEDADASSHDLERYRALGVAELDGSASSRGAIALRNAEGKVFLPEEVAAQLFAYAKGLAEEVGKEKIYGSLDAVVTVPPFYSQYERQAIVDSLELGGLRNLGLLTDGGAIAINYAIPRHFPIPETHIFYDAGAGSVRATAVRFFTREERIHPASKKKANVTQAVVLGATWERKAGGIDLDLRLRELLRKEFEKGEGAQVAGGEGVRRIPRAMVKLLREAQRIKHVLTVNTEVSARIENLAEDVDLRAVITRDQFEAASSDLKDLFAHPIIGVLQKAELSWDNITSVNLVGGTVRVPMVQAAVRSVVPENKLAQNLNADEAAVMGAALFGAGQSAQFKTKDIRLRELVQYPVKLSYEGEGASGLSPAEFTVFNQSTKLGERIRLQIPRTTDFDLALAYTDAPGYPKDLASVSVSGLTKALSNLSDAEAAANKTVTVTVGLSESNIVSIPSAFLRLEGKPDEPSVAGRFKGLFGGSKKEDNETDEAKPAPKGINITVPLTVKTTYKSVQPFSTEDRIQSVKKLKDIDAAQRRKIQRGEARNALESLIYKLRDQVERESFVRASKSGERSQLKKQLDENAEWLWDAAETADTKEFKTKQGDMEKITKKVGLRIDEERERNVTIPLISLQLYEARIFHEQAFANFTAAETAGDPTKYTIEDLDSLEKLVTEANKWWEGAKDKAEKLQPDEDVPANLRNTELRRKVNEVQGEVRRLTARRTPKRKRVTSPSVVSTPAAEGTAAAADPEEAKTATPVDEADATATPTAEKTEADEGASHKKDEL